MQWGEPPNLPLDTPVY